LQLKTGRLDATYFRRKFGVDILAEFADGFHTMADDGLLEIHTDGVALTRAGFLEVDRHLPLFFEPQFRGTRYT
jgi:HemN C-terminal domain